MGLDVGTTSTQMIVSRLRIENRASEFAVPDLVIADREILYESPVHFTPLRSEALVDGEALRTLLLEEYRHAGLTRETVDTGAVIVTGETSRKENAREVAQALSGLAGDFVVATAGPDLESELAARGSGAVAYSAETGKTVLHMDIGGGTANLCLIRGGEIAATGCLNVGGRLLKLDKMGSVTYVPFGAAHSAQQHRVGGQALVQLALGQGIAKLVDGLAAHVGAGVGEGMAVFFRNAVQDAHRLGHNLRAGAVAVNQRNVFLH